MFLINDIEVIKIPVRNSKEPFCNLTEINKRIKVDLSMSQIASKSEYFSYARETIAIKLLEAALLLPEGINFYIKEAYRPLQQQKDSFNSVLEYNRKHYGDLPEEEIYLETCKYVAPPEYAPHPTGAAIDITLINDKGIESDMGTEFNATPGETDNATYFHSDNISDEARENRRILSRALSRMGFVNYEPEWWHWSIGDRYWALLKNEDAAKYDVVDGNWIKKNTCEAMEWK
ncbi:M15 family metallopeptidase [Spirochaeta isovalerica]|uniref:D-alanyl-D-alanine dipeptidase n=1 Tax=Spirochaeta isovalerica TaxID=150 RepID=A0A841REK6_9SPIO|nr:D-alanyl-D-alanine dipeptidase [Spirochaeta isovalerica]